MKSRSFNLLKLAVFSFILMSTLNAHTVPLVSPKDEKDAYIANIIFKAKIRAQKPDIWAFTVRNVNHAENSEDEAQFFFIFYVDSKLWLDEYNSTNYRTWLCKRGENVTRGYSIEGWDIAAPITHDIRVELYWFHGGSFCLEDTATFSIDVTMLVPLKHIYASSYLVVYLLFALLLLSYCYVTGLELEESREEKLVIVDEDDSGC